MVTFEKNKLFELSCQIRPIKAFDPEILLEVDTTTGRRFLSNASKLLWFYQFCAEQGFKGKVDTQFVSYETLKEIPSEEFVGGVAFLVKEYWSATVYINGEAIATAYASGTFAVNDRTERDLASGQLRSNAIGAALSQAGFGVVTGFNMTANDIAQLMAEANQPGAPAPVYTPQQMPTGPLPTAPAAPVAAAQYVMQDNFFGAPSAPAPAPAAPGAPAMYMAPPANTAPAPVAPAQPAQQQVDPLTAAKQMMWPEGGRFKGKTLGTILSEGGVNNIAFIANDYVPRNTDQGQQVKAAAKLILDSLQTGK